MFGISAFVQAPFASLGGDTYSVVVNESTTVSDTNISIASFLGSLSESTTLTDTNISIASFIGIRSESTTLSDSYVGRFSYFVNISETETLTDITIGKAAFSTTITENTVLADALSAIAQFNTSYIELFSVTDYQFGGGWVKINNNQVPYTPQYIDNSFSELSFASLLEN